MHEKLLFRDPETGTPVTVSEDAQVISVHCTGADLSGRSSIVHVAQEPNVVEGKVKIACDYCLQPTGACINSEDSLGCRYARRVAFEAPEEVDQWNWNKSRHE